MEKTEFDTLLLKTAFACMACDGEIDKKEVAMIKKMHEEHHVFGDIDIKRDLDVLFQKINNDGHAFIRSYFSDLKNVLLNDEQEMKIIEVAIDTIKADEKIDYNEVKFFKVIRSRLKIKNDKILDLHPDFEEYLEQDIISESYLARLQNDFFETHQLQKFEYSSLIDNEGNK